MVTTARFRWVAGIAIAMNIVGILMRQEPMVITATLLLMWVGVEWIIFRVFTTLTPSLLVSTERKILEIDPNQSTLNVDHAYTVEVSAMIPRLLGGFRFWLNDLVPSHCQTEENATRFVSDVASEQVICWRYQIHPSVIGRLDLPGIQCVLTDRRGLFRKQAFIPLRRELTILPFVTRPQATVSVLKTNNLQILNGNHRYRRPGYSSELLGIREYQPGDPPRSIAWKPTARLGKLMTCEYENEVPIRSNLICDLSDYQFIGRPGKASADQVVSVGASLAKLLLADRDPVSCDLIAESHLATTPHGHGERQLTRIMQTMLTYCDRQQVNADADTPTLVRLAWVSCYQRFPELFDDRVNRVKPRLFPLAQDTHMLRTQGEQLSFALATLYGLKLGDAERLQYDDQEFRRVIKLYMADYPIRHTLARRMFDANRQRESERRTIATLGQTMMTRISRAKDNELFVILGVAPTDHTELNKLVSTIRLARAANHRVMMVDVSAPPVDDQFVDFRASRILSSTRSSLENEKAERFANAMTSLGATATTLSDPQLVEQAANEIDLLRTGRVRTTVRVPR